MSIATITTTTYTSPTSQSTFLSNLDTAMTTAGFTVYDTKTISTNFHRIYSIVLTGAAQGTVYMRFVLNSSTNVMSSTLMTAWNTSTNTATNEGGNPYTGTSIAVSMTSLATITYRAINAAEIKGVLITQGNVSFLVAVIRPANWESWYSESIWNLALNMSNYNINSTASGSQVQCYGTLLNPNNSASSWVGNFTGVTAGTTSTLLNNVNPFNSNQRQVKPIEFHHPYLYGSVATTSSDLVICCSNGLANSGVDQLVTTSATYLYLGQSSLQVTLTGSGLAVRIA